MIEILNGIHETIAYHDFQGIKLYHNSEAENYPLHWHTALEVVVPCKNSYTIVIDRQAHTLSERDIFITLPGTLHELLAPPSGERLILLFDYSLIGSIKGIDSLLHSLHPFTLIKEADYPELNKKLRFLLDEIAREYDNPMPLTEANVYSLMIRFFVTVGRSSFSTGKCFAGNASCKQHEYIEKFMVICNYITEHCTEDLCMDELADRAGFSRYHFARLFKQFIGISCYEYITRKRMAYVEQLLIQPDLSITDAAMLSGFNSLSTFNRVFKARKGYTPSEYKRLNHPEKKQ